MDFKSLVPWRNNSKPQMPAMREDFFDPFVTFRREMDRMFDDFFGSAPRNGMHALTPAVDVDENDKEVVVKAELPEDVEVNVAGDVLTIKGEKKAEHEEKNGDGYYMERRFGSFARSIRLPFEVKDQDAEAKFTNGVLTVRLPKPADMQKSVRRIEVKSQ